MSAGAADTPWRAHPPRAPHPPCRRALPADGPAGPAAPGRTTTPAAIPGGIR